MRRSYRVLVILIALVLGAAVVRVAEWRAQAQERFALPQNAGRPIVLAGLAQETDMSRPSLQLRTVVSRAWSDAIATWKLQLSGKGDQIESIQVRFISRLSPTNCYGLFAGQGPVYCSGNRTVFVGTQVANRMMSQFGPQAEAGITFLIGHEFGHHVQNLLGRFRWLRGMVTMAPAGASNLIRRFELEADCLAGVWMHNSRTWADSNRFKSDLLAFVKTIGDDSIAGGEATPGVSARSVHGTSEQRARWFSQGLKSGDAKACNTFRLANP